MDSISLAEERRLILRDYESYLKLWSYSIANRRMAVAQDLLQWLDKPIKQIRSEDWQDYGEQRGSNRLVNLRSFRHFLEETGRLARPNPPEVAPVNLPKASAELVSEFLRARKRGGQPRDCRAADRRRLENFFSVLPLARRENLTEIRSQEVEAFIEHKQDRNCQASTINRQLKTVRSFFEWLLAEGRLTGPNPVGYEHYLVEADPLPRAMRGEDVKAFLAVLEDCQWRALFLILLRTGMRVGELLQLRVCDVDLARATLMIHSGGKNSRGRVVYLAQDAELALKEWLLARQRFPVERLFFTGKSHGLNIITVRKHFHFYLTKAGIQKRYRVHDLRHTFATEMLNCGVPITTLQQLLGHLTITITQRYARVSDTTKREQYYAAMNRISQRDGSLPMAKEAKDVKIAG